MGDYYFHGGPQAGPFIAINSLVAYPNLQRDPLPGYLTVTYLLCARGTPPRRMYMSLAPSVVGEGS